MTEPTVTPNTPMPPGYCFVRKGNVYITAHCRKASVAAGHPVYTVVASTAPGAAVLGLRCPRAIHREVCAAEAETRADRATAVARRDAHLADTFREALLAQYPSVPADRVPVLVQHAMAKHRGRVARTATLDLAARVRLAVRAHIRHRDTAYEQMLGAKRKGGKKKANEKTREAVRAQIVKQVDAIERAWKTTAKTTAKTATTTDKAATDTRTETKTAKTKTTDGQTKTTTGEANTATAKTTKMTPSAQPKTELPLRVAPAGRVLIQRASKQAAIARITEMAVEYIP